MVDIDRSTVYSKKIRNWKPDGDKWGHFSAILSGMSKIPDEIRVFYRTPSFYLVSPRVRSYKVPQSLLNKQVPYKIQKQVISWTRFGDFDLFFHRHGNDSQVTWIYKQVIRKTSASPLSLTGYHVPKLSIYDVEGNGENDNVSLAVTYGDFWSLKTVSYGDTIKFWPKTRHMVTRELFGCPRNLCFDGRIDAAYQMDDGSVIFLVGKYNFTLVGHELSKGKKISWLGDGLNTESITAAANIFDNTENLATTFVVTSTGRVVINDPLIPLRARDVFPDLNETTYIDAAIGEGNQLTLIVGRHHSVYTYDGGDFHLNTSYDLNVNRWSPIFRNIDAAYSNGSSIYFISESFFVTSDTTNNRSELVQRNLFKCTDTLENFVSYQEHFRPMLEFKPIIMTTLETTTIITTTPSTTSPPVTTLKTGPTKATIAIIVLSVVLVVLILLIFSYLCKSRADRTKTISINNQDTTTVTKDSNSNIGSEMDDHLSHHNVTPVPPTTVKTNNTFNSMQPISVQTNTSNTSTTQPVK